MEQIIESKKSMRQEEINQAILFRESVRAIIPKIDLEDASISLEEMFFEWVQCETGYNRFERSRTVEAYRAMKLLLDEIAKDYMLH